MRERMTEDTRIERSSYSNTGCCIMHLVCKAEAMSLRRYVNSLEIYS